MAKANKSTKTVEKVTYVTEEFVTLELSIDEARTVRALFGRVSNTGPIREHADAIYDALSKAKVYAHVEDFVFDIDSDKIRIVESSF